MNGVVRWRVVVSIFLCTAVSISLAAKPAGAKPSAGERYLDLVNAIASSRAQMPHITASAEKAAKQVLAGGTLWVTGNQPDFASEALGRAGGLMAVKSLGDQATGPRDVILFATPRMVSEPRFIKWKNSGADVVVFNNVFDSKYSGSITSGAWGVPVFPETKERLICPADTVNNVINLWVWTGEFAAACTRAGKMPVFYKTIGLPGGRERIEKYKGKIFHDDLTVKPVGPGVLGRAYLDQIEGMLKTIRAKEMGKIRQAAAWWQVANIPQPLGLVMGHMFPAHFQDPRAPQRMEFQAFVHDRKLEKPILPGQFILYVGYQYVPQNLINQVMASKGKLVYFSVQAARPAEPADNIIYINPHWPLADACVTVPGYDVPILPASGVVDAAIYWALLAAACEKPASPSGKCVTNFPGTP